MQSCILQNLILDFCIYDELLFVNFSVFIFFFQNKYVIDLLNALLTFSI